MNCKICLLLMDKTITISAVRHKESLQWHNFRPANNAADQHVLVAMTVVLLLLMLQVVLEVVAIVVVVGDDDDVLCCYYFSSIQNNKSKKNVWILAETKVSWQWKPLIKTMALCHILLLCMRCSCGGCCCSHHHTLDIHYIVIYNINTL